MKLITFIFNFILIPSLILAAPAVGKMAPDFELQGQDGKTYSLNQFKGKHVVLEWYNKGCPYVKKHYGSNNMQKLQEKYAKAGVVWFSIISSAPEKQGYMNAKEVIRDRKEGGIKSTATLLDPTGKVGRLYDAKTTPHLFVINPKGEVVYMGAIDSNDSSDPSTIADAKNYVSLALDASMKNQPIKVSTSRPYGCSVKYN